MKTQMRAAIYSRVSVSSQDAGMQIRELREYCKNRNWKIIGEFVDSGVSGAVEARPALSKLMQEANRRRFDALVVWDFSRFARSASHLLRALETFSALEISFISLREQIDTSTAQGKLVFTVLGAVGEMEREIISARVRAGLRNARAKGVRLGRPPLKRLIQVEMQQLRHERRHSKISFKDLAKKFGVSTWTAFEICKKPARKTVQ